MTQKEVYEQFKDKISFHQFQSIWQGRSWCNVMSEVFTEENKNYYIYQKDKENTLLKPKEVLNYRKLYIDHTAKEVYQQMIKDKGQIMKERTFQKILVGDVREESIYKEIPIYKKFLKRWELNGEPVQTGFGSES